MTFFFVQNKLSKPLFENMMWAFEKDEPRVFRSVRSFFCVFRKMRHGDGVQGHRQRRELNSVRQRDTGRCCGSDSEAGTGVPSPFRRRAEIIPFELDLG